MELNLKEKQKLTRITAKKYQWANKKDKTKILDTFIGQTGYVRKYAAHIFANEGKVKYERNRVRLKAAHGSKKKRGLPARLQSSCSGCADARLGGF